jgi:peptidoglycan/LPS O-acetylase OafA/YrhL
MVLLGALVTTRNLDEYFGPQTFNFFWRDAGLFFGQRNELPGVFQANPVSGMNASLWTLPPEARLYLYLVLGIFILRYNRVAIIVLFFAMIAGLIFSGKKISIDEPSFRLSLLFITGSGIAAIQGQLGIWVAVPTALSLVALFTAVGDTVAATLIATALGAIVVGSLPCPSCLRLPIDISYGVYLFAFPIQQFVVTLALPFWAGLSLTICFTVAVATICAVFVEQPALRLAKHFKEIVLARNWRF